MADTPTFAVELVAKHVHDIRWAERGWTVGPTVSAEDREIAKEIVADLGLAEACAAVPQPLARAETRKLADPSMSYKCFTLDIPPGTKVAVYRADQIPASVTREQIDSVVFQWFGSVIADWMAVNGLEVTEGESLNAQDQLVDQLMALLLDT